MPPLCVAGAGIWHACMYERDYANREIGGRERFPHRRRDVHVRIAGELLDAVVTGGQPRPPPRCSCQRRTRACPVDLGRRERPSGGMDHKLASVPPLIEDCSQMQ